MFVSHNETERDDQGAASSQSALKIHLVAW